MCPKMQRETYQLHIEYHTLIILLSDFKECATNITCAAAMVDAYMNLAIHYYDKKSISFTNIDCNGDGKIKTCDDYAMIHYHSFWGSCRKNDLTQINPTYWDQYVECKTFFEDRGIFV